MESKYTALMQIAAKPDICFTEGQGSYLYDRDGNAWLDFVQGWAVNTLGHSPEPVAQAICAQSRRLINPSPAFYNDQALQLANRLTTLSGMDQVFFANSGAEANEGAIKLARKWGQKHRKGAWKIITFHNGFHGRTLATMSATGKPAFEPLFNPKVPGFTKVPYGDLEAVAAAIDEQTVAILLEPIQGEAGVIPASSDFLQGLRALADRQGLLLMLDEVQTGIGRTGNLFCYQQHAIEPDVVTLGKGLGGGVPIAALMAKQHACCFEYGDQGGTFNGNPLVCAAALAVLEQVTTQGFLEQVNAASSYLSDRLMALSTRYDMGPVRGTGLLLALETGSLDAPAIVKQALELGLLINAPRPHTLRLMPSLTVSNGEIDRMAELLDAAIQRSLA
ncbi:acetylornithine aminotransferase 2 [Marinobacterium zhoushanense]|uniref:Acetylornithine aminotransferase n=1 Tax=Marinobacterium zhoushanense TaxID=1679163 RepID=A0ABQ1KU61_9GAMM|nr:acetylornithine transaminase [Marinobacterium zhoushanense]GGC05612.1 acetylornithine aminotransferase 2 [Marinobacterium zhoushanense]